MFRYVLMLVVGFLPKTYKGGGAGGNYKDCFLGGSLESRRIYILQSTPMPWLGWEQGFDADVMCHLTTSYIVCPLVHSYNI